MLDSPLRAPSSGSFSLVTGGPAEFPPSRHPSGSGEGGGGTRSGVSASRSPEATNSASTRQLSWQEREEIYDEIGEWFLRCLRGCLRLSTELTLRLGTEMLKGVMFLFRHGGRSFVREMLLVLTAGLRNLQMSCLRLGKIQL